MENEHGWPEFIELPDIAVNAQGAPLDRVIAAIFRQLLLIRTETALLLSYVAEEQMPPDECDAWIKHKVTVVRKIAQEIQRDPDGE